MKEQPLRSYIVKKYVKARSVAQAMRIANESPVHEVVLDEENTEESSYIEAIGYQYTPDEDYEVPDEYSKAVLK